LNLQNFIKTMPTLALPIFIFLELNFFLIGICVVSLQNKSFYCFFRKKKCLFCGKATLEKTNHFCGAGLRGWVVPPLDFTYRWEPYSERNYKKKDIFL
jgi:hypothetical protein